MDFIIDNWYFALIILAVLVCAVAFVIKFLRTPREEQLKSIREWLLYATTLAEKEFGSGTGRLKLRMVYDMFLTKFPWVARLITFERFGELVDEALGTMNDMLSGNAAVQLYVNGPSDANDDTEAVG